MEDYIVSSGNIFEDMGFADAEERLAKAKLAAIINKVIDEKGLTQKETAKILGVNQPKISALKNGRLKGFSMERVFSFLERWINILKSQLLINRKQKPDWVLMWPICRK